MNKNTLLTHRQNGEKRSMAMKLIDNESYYKNGWEESHDIFDAALNGGAELHRFINEGGVEYSAIYKGNREIWSCERAHESEMIADWNKAHWEDDM